MELDPNDRQATHFRKCAGTARFAWNWALAERQRLYAANVGKERFTDAVEQHRHLNSLKKSEWPWMYDVSKCVPQEALRNLDNAYHQYRLAKKAGRRARLPVFKKRGQARDSFSFTTGAIRCEGRHAVLPRIGRVRLKEAAVVDGRVLRATVSREADRWFVSFSVETEIPDPAPINGPIVGIDLGLIDFAVLSDGERVGNPRHLGRDLRLLRRRSQQHSRKARGSANRAKSALRLARLHFRIRNRRRDFLHKLTTRLARTKRVVVIEDLDVAGLRNGRHSRSVSDAGWAEFRRMLEYKCRWFGCRLVVAPRGFASSKTCFPCGAKNAALDLSDRTWICPSCGAVWDRDLNAARNLVAWYETNGTTGSSPGSHASGDLASTPPVVVARAGSSKEEANAVWGDVLNG